MKTLRSRPQGHISKVEPIMPLQFQIDECPEQNATQHLLEISDQDLQFNAFNHIHVQEKQLIRLSQIQKRKPKSAVKQTKKERVSVTNNFTECCQISRKKTCSSHVHQDSVTNFQKNALNPCNFLVLSNQNYKNIKVFDASAPRKPQNVSESINFKLKQTKHIGALIRKRNKSLLKNYLQYQQQLTSVNSNTLKRSGSPKAHTNRVSQSCQLSSSNQKDYQSPMKITASIKKQQQKNYIELKHTNHNFRNKRLSYRGIKYAK